MYVNGKAIWDRETKGSFPEPNELKQILRDLLAPSKDLGQSDTKENDEPELDEEELEKMRAFYGVM